MTQNISDRMKRYEITTQQYLTNKTPVLIRVDGKSFSSWTKFCKKPFDTKLEQTMDYATMMTAKQMQGFMIAYTQSDEATFMITDEESLQKESWFGNKISKLISITASYFTYYFNSQYPKLDNPAIFDARAFNVPSADFANAFIWRQKDWRRNSISMLARSHFSTKEMYKKSQQDLLDMLKNQNVFWEDLPDRSKYGCFILNNFNSVYKYLDYNSIMNLCGYEEEEPEISFVPISKRVDAPSVEDLLDNVTGILTK